VPTWLISAAVSRCTNGPFNVLTEFSSLPDGLLDLNAQQLAGRLPGPTLIHLPGRHARPLFVSVLLHGNEDTGWEAVRALLGDYQSKTLPRALSVFIGNVAAAREGLRRLDGQPDYNHVWPGCDSSGTLEHGMMRAVLEHMRERDVFASIDIHNNTGINPHYACVNQLEPCFFKLATLFSRTVVYFTRPIGVQAIAFASLCPAVTVECGKVGSKAGAGHARDFIESALDLDDLSHDAVGERDMDLFHTVAIVKVPEHLAFSFDDAHADIVFRQDIDHMNFRELPEGTVLGSINTPQARLDAWDESGQELGDYYFDHNHGQIRTRRPLMPSMLTCDERVIRQDCLCYLMERL